MSVYLAKSLLTASLHLKLFSSDILKQAIQWHHFNHFIAPACKFSGLKDGRTGLQTVYLPGPVTHLLPMLGVLMKTLSHASAKAKTKRLMDFKFRTFNGRFEVTSRQ